MSTSRSHDDAYHGPAEDRDGEYDLDSTVYCTDLMASTANGYDRDDEITGWVEGRTPRNSSSTTSATDSNPKGHGLMSMLKRSKNNNSNDKKSGTTSGAAAIALAYNDFDDDDSSTENKEEGESDLLDQPSARPRDDGYSRNDDYDEEGTVQTVQTKTDVFLKYAVDDSTIMEDGMDMSTVAPATEELGGGQGQDRKRSGRDSSRDSSAECGRANGSSSSGGRSSSGTASGNSSSSSTMSPCGGGGSLVSSLASGGVSKYVMPVLSPSQLHHYVQNQKDDGVPDWARQTHNGTDGSEHDERRKGGPTAGGVRHHHHHHHSSTNKPPPTATTKKPTSKYHRSKSGSTDSTTIRRRNKVFTVLALSMLLLGLCAVVLGVSYGMGLFGGSGGGSGNGNGSGGGKSTGSSSSSAGMKGAQACARTGGCGEDNDDYYEGEDENGNQNEEEEDAVPMDDANGMVPTDRPTSPPFDVADDGGGCAAHGVKSQSCGAHNPDHPARCCPGLYCSAKVCRDPNHEDDERDDADDPVEKDGDDDEATDAATKTTPSPSPPLITEEPTTEAEPTAHPTSAAPTKPPTPNIWISQPTAELVAEGVVLPQGHFTYDPDDAVYGPTSWSNPQYTATTSLSLDGKDLKDTTKLAEMGSDELDGLEVVPAEQASAEYKFWSRHAWSIDPNRKMAITDNVCDGLHERAEQSPIDVYVQSGDLDETGDETGIPGSIIEPRCMEHHEIRIKSGQFGLDNVKIRKEILPSQLRLTYPDPTFEADGKTLAADSKLPTADFPHGWGGNMEALRVDVKIPSEHWLNGQEYAAEYQIYHLHHKKKRAPVISVLVDLHPLDKPNEHFQLALDQWQAVWQRDYLECELRERRERRATASLMEAVKSWIIPASASSKQEKLRQSTILDEPAEELEQLRRNLRAAARRVQEDSGFWDPYKKDEIMRSIHFFAYSGSLTEPPCTEFIDWRILDTPMLISRRQLFQMKTLLFNHRSIESGCRPSSNHHMGSVARRPLQPLNRRKVYRCTCRDFLSDDERDEALALDGMTEANATYTPRCSKREFRLAEKKRDWLHRPEEEL